MFLLLFFESCYSPLSFDTFNKIYKATFLQCHPCTAARQRSGLFEALGKASSNYVACECCCVYGMVVYSFLLLDVITMWSGQLEMLWFVRGFLLCRIVRTNLRVVMAKCGCKADSIHQSAHLDHKSSRKELPATKHSSFHLVGILWEPFRPLQAALCSYSQTFEPFAIKEEPGECLQQCH